MFASAFLKDETGTRPSGSKAAADESTTRKQALPLARTRTPCGTHYRKTKMKTEITWAFGQFRTTVAVEADVDGVAAGPLLRLAALNVLQRGPATAAEKAIAGYAKRPAGFDRRNDPSMAYTEDRAARVAEAFTGEVNIQDTDDGKPEVKLRFAATDVTDQTKYAGGGSERKFTTELATIADWLRPAVAEKLPGRLALIKVESIDPADPGSMLAAARALDAYFKAQRAAL